VPKTRLKVRLRLIALDRDGKHSFERRYCVHVGQGSSQRSPDLQGLSNHQTVIKVFSMMQLAFALAGLSNFSIALQISFTLLGRSFLLLRAAFNPSCINAIKRWTKKASEQKGGLLRHIRHCVLLQGQNSFSQPSVFS
jgi:hypothetical protein